jgi:hypothetical protein
MATRVPTATPTGVELRTALNGFAVAVAAVAIVQSRDTGPRWIEGELPPVVSNFVKNFSDEDANRIVADFGPIDSPALAFLYVELLHYAWRHAPLVEAVGDLLPETAIDLSGSAVTGEAQTDAPDVRSVKDAVVMQGSIEFLLAKLPWPLRRLVDAIMEALRISRGVT